MTDCKSFNSKQTTTLSWEGFVIMFGGRERRETVTQGLSVSRAPRRLEVELLNSQERVQGGAAFLRMAGLEGIGICLMGSGIS